MKRLRYEQIRHIYGQGSEAVIAHLVLLAQALGAVTELERHMSERAATVLSPLQRVDCRTTKTNGTPWALAARALAWSLAGKQCP